MYNIKVFYATGDELKGHRHRVWARSQLEHRGDEQSESPTRLRIGPGFFANTDVVSSPTKIDDHFLRGI
jgi:hypothetical protein